MTLPNTGYCLMPWLLVRSESGNARRIPALGRNPTNPRIPRRSLTSLKLFGVSPAHRPTRALPDFDSAYHIVVTNVNIKPPPARDARAGLERYLQQRRPYAPFDDHVFVSLRRKPLLPTDVDRAFRTAVKRCGLPHGRGGAQPLRANPRIAEGLPLCAQEASRRTIREAVEH